MLTKPKGECRPHAPPCNKATADRAAARRVAPLLAGQMSPDYIRPVPTIDLPADELAAVAAAIRVVIEGDRYPHAPRLDQSASLALAIFTKGRKQLEELTPLASAMPALSGRWNRTLSRRSRCRARARDFRIFSRHSENRPSRGSIHLPWARTPVPQSNPPASYVTTLHCSSDYVVPRSARRTQKLNRQKPGRDPGSPTTPLSPAAGLRCQVSAKSPQ